MREKRNQTNQCVIIKKDTTAAMLKTSSFSISPASSPWKHAPVIERCEIFDIRSVVYRGVELMILNR
jgi:hypothetical protein